MWDHTKYVPILLEIYQILAENEWFEKYLKNSFKRMGSENPLELIMTLLTVHIGGFEYLAHYKEAEKEVQEKMSKICKVQKTAELKEILSQVEDATPSLKLLLLQRRILDEHGRDLCRDGQCKQKTLDIDSTTLTSFAKKRKGAEVGQNTKYKGKPCYQLSVVFLAQVFIDCKLSPGNANPKSLFRKLVKRARYIGYDFTAVRADAAYGNAENILFLQELSLHYAIGANIPLVAVKNGIERFKSLSHQKGSPGIVSIHKGLSALDLGTQTIFTSGGKPISTRIIICRRVQRRKKKNGRWSVKHYYYAILTDFSWAVTKVIKYYHQRQKVENGIKELKYHYSLNRMAHQDFKANEFYITSKIFALAMVKVFSLKYLPKRLRHFRLKTLIRKVFSSTLREFSILRYSHFSIKVVYVSNSQYLWHFKRIVSKLVSNHSRLQANKLAA